MKPFPFISASFLLLFLFNSNCFSNDFDFSKSSKHKDDKGFRAGLNIGALFANKYTSKFYDGYGYDAEGNRNEFRNDVDWEKNSFMRRKIILEYGGLNGQPDLVAQALGVNPGEWRFDVSDMPANMKYNPAFMVGVQLFYSFSKKDALLLNINAAKLTLSGNFTIVVTNPLIGPQQPGFEDIKTFSINGAEQRLMFQLGYRRILGDPEESVLNFFIEGGPALNMTKFLKNQITINTLQIDLATYYTNQSYTTYHAKFLSGIGFGGFAGFGLDLKANPKWTLQLLYNPSYEKINIGEKPKLTLQHSVGLRAFYNL